MVTNPAIGLCTKDEKKPENFDKSPMETYRSIHKTIHEVSADLDRFHFNKAVARIRELTNAVACLDGQDAGASWVHRQGLETVVRLIGPMMPHLAEELWSTLGHDTILTETPWPIADKSLLEDDHITIAVQVNGKLRGTLEVVTNCDKTTIEEQALALDGVVAIIGENPVRKIIVIPNRIVNIVV
jgi:leucyl-tRNA synthetase